LEYKDIIGYEGLYKISSEGNGNIINNKGKSKTQSNRNGYLSTCLYKNNIGKTFYLHRLLGLHFIKIIEGKNQINHKNGDKKNNRLLNLEWCNSSGNIKHSFDVLNRIPTFLDKFGKEHNRSLPVIQYDKDMNFVKEWENAYCVYREIKIHQQNISKVCTGKRNYAGGFIWRYKKDKENNEGRFPAQMFISTDIGNMIDEQSDKGGASKILNKIDFTEEDEY